MGIFEAFHLALPAMPNIESMGISLGPTGEIPYVLHFGEKEVLERCDVSASDGWKFSEQIALQVRCPASAISSVFDIRHALYGLRGVQYLLRWDEIDRPWRLDARKWKTWHGESSAWRIDL